MTLFGERLTVTRSLSRGLADDGRDFRLAWRLATAGRGDPGFGVSLDATRSEPASDNGGPVEHRVTLRAGSRW